MSAVWEVLSTLYAIVTQNGDPTVYEDNLFWDCATMGNGVCGPNAKMPGEL
ncbi:hypothetical protein HOS75_gp027 [Gordonia phage SteveFrench]|uniref:Uncharacterized protein n=2 Tax=Montyvirus stevefrench TaxID=2734258 RepID=A0A890UT67_9CAUD|nr:hypothetical protein HOS75_gp027 [Gordonia phage SteveFrench]AUV60703.1 hypothetical protein SEA_STEVEFRENCH_101 [Gordonia phage SteveFrench]QRI45686.1 hypothetical protein SEA_ROYALG_102 [Gordonia phage RoyalG]